MTEPSAPSLERDPPPQERPAIDRAIRPHTQNDDERQPERPQHSTAAIALPESVWRERPGGDPYRDGSRVVMSQWAGIVGKHALEVESDTADEHHTLSVCYKRPDADLIIDGRVVWSGKDGYEPYVLTGPRESGWKAVFRSSYETLRVYIPQSLISECHAEMFGRPPGGAIKLVQADTLRDPGLRQLAQVFKLAYASKETFGPIFLESLGMALVYRMLQGYCKLARKVERKAAPAAHVRFENVTDYIEDNLSNPLSLEDLSGLAGLSKMYFASQFKKATGMSPHAYIVRRRILRAQNLLTHSDESVMQIALSLGFASHSHLTTTFKRLVGRTPEEWRQEQDR